MTAFDHRRLVQQIAAELQVISLRAYHHDGVGTICLRDEEISGFPMVEQDLELAITQEVAQFIYVYYHLADMVQVNRLKSPNHERLIPIVLLEDEELGGKLREANRASGYLDRGWQIISVAEGDIIVRKTGICLWVQPTEIVTLSDRPKAGDFAEIRFPKDMPYVSPGYYTAIADAGPQNSRVGHLLRVYMNISATGAPDLLMSLTFELNKCSLKFSLKILNDPRAYTRADTAVLYIQRDDFPFIRHILSDIVTSLSPKLRDVTPAFAKRIAKGVAVAEEPSSGISRQMSFGQHRSLLVAQGIVEAFVAGRNTAEERRTRITQQFHLAGVDVSRPYLNQESNDIYRELIVAQES